MGKYPESIAHYQEAIRLQPDNFNALANMALAYAAVQQPADAIAAAEKAITVAQSKGETGLAQQIAIWLAQYRQQGSLNPTPQSEPPRSNVSQ